MADFMALDSQAHQNTGWRPAAHYAFAAQHSVVPIVAAELADTLATMPIAWVKTAEERFQLVALLTLIPGQNVFVHPQSHKWIAGYTPLQFRTYPFAMLPVEGQPDKRALCIDRDSGLVESTDELGVHPFYESGAHSDALKPIVEQLKHAEQNRIATQKATDALAAQQLFTPWALKTKNKAGEVIPLKGVYRIDDEALRQLDAEAIQALINTDALSIAYGQLLSMKRTQVLAQLHQALAKQQPAPSATPEDIDLDDMFGENDDSLFRF